MRDTQFHLTSGNEIAITGLPGQVGMEFGVYLETNLVSKYRIEMILVDGTTTVAIQDLFQDQPIIDGQSYIINGQALYGPGDSGDHKEVTWVAPKANPGPNPAPANNTRGTIPPAVPAASAAQAAVAAPSPSDPDTDKVTEIRTRLDRIERHLDISIKRMENVKNPSKGYLSRVDGMIQEMRNGTEDISKIISSIETSKPTECVDFKNQMAEISKRMEELEGICRGLRTVANKKSTAPTPTQAPAPTKDPSDLDLAKATASVLATIATSPTSSQTQAPTPVQAIDPLPATTATPTQATAPTPAPTPAQATVQTIDPAPTPVPPPTTPLVDLGPTNDRIDDLEEELAKLALQLADKASAEDLANLSGSVDGLGEQVSSLKGQVSGIETTIEKAGKTSNDRLDQLMAAISALKNQQVPVPTTAPTTPATAPALLPVKNTVPVTVPPAPPVKSTVPTTAPTQVTAVNPPSKGKKKSRRESVNFFALVLGIVLGVLALIAIFFYATRSQSIDAERIGASEAKSAAAAEMENAKRLQMETTEAVNNLRQQVEGYKRQTLVMPPPPLSSTVTNTIVMTNTIVVTNTLAPSSNTNGAVTNTFGKLSYHLDRPIEGISLGDTFEMQPCIEAYWFPSWTQNLYGYRKARGFNGYLEPR